MIITILAACAIALLGWFLMGSIAGIARGVYDLRHEGQEHRPAEGHGRPPITG